MHENHVFAIEIILRKAYWDNLVTWHWPLAQMIYSINESLVSLLIWTWDKNLLEINHQFNLSPSVNGLPILSACYYFKRNITHLHNFPFLSQCPVNFTVWVFPVYGSAFNGWNKLLQVHPVDQWDTDRLFAGMTSEPARGTNLPGPPAGARTWHLLKALGVKGWVVMLMVGAFGLYVGGIVTWCWSPLPFPTVALNHHSAAPLAN